MANTINYAALFQGILDEKLVQDMTTAWTEAGADRVIYNGGNEIKIAKLGLDDLADYSRATGYADGDITLEWETHKFAYDRGRKFSIDAMDVDETNFTATAGNVMGEFVRTKVVPEIDLIRIAKLAGKAGNSKDITLDEATALKEFKTGVAKVRDAGYEGQLVAHVTFEFMNLLELHFSAQLGAVTFAIDGVDTTFPSIDGVALIPTQSTRMFEKVKKSGQAYVGDGKAVAFLIAGREVPLGIVKHAPARTFLPEENMDADAYVINYRVYHDLFVEDNKVDAVYVGFVAAGE